MRRPQPITRLGWAILGLTLALLVTAAIAVELLLD
jgi:hypothetical protein